MKCQSCSANIPPEWVHAIQQNLCPGCGDQIMNDSSKGLLDELTLAMEKMPNNPQGVAGWLLSNYIFEKIGDAVPAEKFHQKNVRTKNDDVDSGNLKVADNPVHKFLSRTNSFRGIQETTSKLADKSSKLAQMARGIAEVETEAVVEAELPEEMDEAELEEREAMAQRGPKKSRALVGSALVDPSASPLTAEDIRALSSSVNGESASFEDEDEMFISGSSSAQKVLQLQRMKRLRAQQSVAGGGGRGVFRRSE